MIQQLSADQTLALDMSHCLYDTDLDMNNSVTNVSQNFERYQALNVVPREGREVALILSLFVMS